MNQTVAAISATRTKAASLLKTRNKPDFNIQTQIPISTKETPTDKKNLAVIFTGLRRLLDAYSLPCVLARFTFRRALDGDKR